MLFVFKIKFNHLLLPTGPGLLSRYEPQHQCARPEVICAATSSHLPTSRRLPAPVYLSHLQSSSLLIFISRGASPVDLSTHHTHAWRLRRPERSVRSPELEFQMVMNYHIGAGNQTSLLQEQPVLLIIEQSLQLYSSILTRQIKVSFIAYEDY